MKKYGAFFYILVAAVLLAIVLLFVRLSPGTEVDTPPVSLATPPITETPENDPDDHGQSQTVEVTAETVQAVIASLPRAESYSRVLKAESFWSGGSSSTDYSLWVHGGSTKISCSESEGVVKNVLISDGRRYVWYSDSDGVYEGPAADDDAEAFQRILGYGGIMELSPDQIDEAGVISYGGVSCIYVSCYHGRLGYGTIWYISLETGLIQCVETYDGDRIIHRVRASATELSTPDEEIFALPEAYGAESAG